MAKIKIKNELIIGDKLVFSMDKKTVERILNRPEFNWSRRLKTMVEDAMNEPLLEGKPNPDDREMDILLQWHWANGAPFVVGDMVVTHFEAEWPDLILTSSDGHEIASVNRNKYVPSYWAVQVVGQTGFCCSSRFDKDVSIQDKMDR